MILAVIFITVRRIYQLKCNPQEIFVIIGAYIFRYIHIFLINKLLYHLIQLRRISEAKCIQHKIADSASGSKDNHALIIILRPAACFYIVLPLIQIFVLRHLIEHIRAHHHGHNAV